MSAWSHGARTTAAVAETVRLDPKAATAAVNLANVTARRRTTTQTLQRAERTSLLNSKRGLNGTTPVTASK